MTEPPVGVEPYRTVGPFTAETVPAGLTKRHATKAGVWGRIEVLAGSLVLARYDAADVVARETICAGEVAYVAPREVHAVTLDADAAFRVTFMRLAEPAEEAD